jgi:hypothetical protein
MKGNEIKIILEDISRKLDILVKEINLTKGMPDRDFENQKKRAEEFRTQMLLLKENESELRGDTI